MAKDKFGQVYEIQGIMYDGTPINEVVMILGKSQGNATLVAYMTGEQFAQKKPWKITKDNIRWAAWEAFSDLRVGDSKNLDRIYIKRLHDTQ